MAKEVAMKKFSEEQLVELAEKFGKIPESFRKKADIIAAGYLTEEEFSQLPYCPRTGEVESCGKWPKIGGRKIYPLSGALTSEETAKYYELKKGYSTGTGSGSSKGPSEEALKRIESIRAFLKEKGADADILAQFEEIVPHKKVGLLEKLIGYSSVAALPGKVNLAYLMLRDAEGKHYPELQPDFGKAISEGYYPNYGLPEIKNMIKTLKEKDGIILDNVIVDLKA